MQGRWHDGTGFKKFDPFWMQYQFVPALFSVLMRAHFLT
jgi:hypothetical protein